MKVSTGDLSLLPVSACRYGEKRVERIFGKRQPDGRRWVRLEVLYRGMCGDAQGSVATERRQIRVETIAQGSRCHVVRVTRYLLSGSPVSKVVSRDIFIHGADRYRYRAMQRVC